MSFIKGRERVPAYSHAVIEFDTDPAPHIDRVQTYFFQRLHKQNLKLSSAKA